MAKSLHLHSSLPAYHKKRYQEDYSKPVLTLKLIQATAFQERQQHLSKLDPYWEWYPANPGGQEIVTLLRKQ